jgi:hypothetical protein
VRFDPEDASSFVERADSGRVKPEKVVIEIEL